MPHHGDLERNPHQIRAITLIVEDVNGTTSETYYADQMTEFRRNTEAIWVTRSGEATSLTHWELTTVHRPGRLPDPNAGPPAPQPTGYAAGSVLDDPPPSTTITPTPEESALLRALRGAPQPALPAGTTQQNNQ